MMSLARPGPSKVVGSTSKPAARLTLRLHSVTWLQSLEEKLMPLESSAITTDQPGPFPTFCRFLCCLMSGYFWSFAGQFRTEEYATSKQAN